MVEDKKLTAQEILEQYPNKFSLPTLYRLDRRGELKPCGRVGKKTRVWKRSAVEAYLGLKTPLPEPEKDLSGFVYLLKCQEFHKIGSSKDPQKRVKNLTLGLYPVELVHSISCAHMRKSEKDLHRKFASKRLRGEWFELSKRDVEYIKEIKQL